MKRKWTYKPSFFLRPILEIIAYLLTRERKGTETFHKALVQPPSVVGCDLPVNFLPRQRSEPFSMCFSIIFSSVFISLLIPCVAFASCWCILTESSEFSHGISFSRLQPSVWKCILTPPIWKVSHSFRLIMWSVCLVSPFTESAAAWHWARCMILCTLENGQWSIWVIEVIRNSPSDISVIGQEDWVISWVMAAIHQRFSNLRLHIYSHGSVSVAVS